MDELVLTTEHLVPLTPRVAALATTVVPPSRREQVFAVHAPALAAMLTSLLGMLPLRLRHLHVHILGCVMAERWRGRLSWGRECEQLSNLFFVPVHVAIREVDL